MTFEVGKRYKTRCGYDVDILGEYDGGEFRFIGAYNSGMIWKEAGWTKDGYFNPESGTTMLDLVKPDIVEWINIYTGGKGNICDTREECDSTPAARDRIGVLLLQIPQDGSLPTATIHKP